jgi:hypothetical protein
MMIGWTNKGTAKIQRKKDEKSTKEQGKGRSNIWKLSETLP